MFEVFKDVNRQTSVNIDSLIADIFGGNLMNDLLLG